MRGSAKLLNVAIAEPPICFWFSRVIGLPALRKSAASVTDNAFSRLLQLKIVHNRNYAKQQPSLLTRFGTT
jgi:hypothetical protein